jgi:hypothetical protein
MTKVNKNNRNATKGKSNNRCCSCVSLSLRSPPCLGRFGSSVSRFALKMVMVTKVCMKVKGRWKKKEEDSLAYWEASFVEGGSAQLEENHGINSLHSLSWFSETLLIAYRQGAYGL